MILSHLVDQNDYTILHLFLQDQSGSFMCCQKCELFENLIKCVFETF